MTVPEGYALRPATAADAPAIARQRGQMFVDMATLTSAEADAHQGLWTGWLREALTSGDYVGLLAECGGEVAGGAGLMFFPQIPTLRDPSPRKAHVLNVFVAPGYRRRGLAGALMQAMLEEVRARGLRGVTLNAAPMGRSLYDRLGFLESGSPELRLTLEPSR